MTTIIKCSNGIERLAPSFTVADGIAVQQSQLNKWKTIMRPSVFKMFRAWVEKHNKNKRLLSGYDVLRGNEMDRWICNYPTHTPSQKFDL